MNWIDVISAILGLTTVVLAGRNSKYNFWVGYAYNIFLFCLFWKQNLWAAMALQPVAFAINLYGHWRWTHPSAEETSARDGKSLKVSSVGVQEWIFSILLAIGGACGIIAMLLQTNDPAPVLDGSILALTFLAQWLSAQKKWECWVVWLLVNAGNLTLYIVGGLKFMPLVSALYIINGLWSLYSWRMTFNKGE